ncbi:hypothetical protein S101446_00459 [Komagataeibacter europaeus]|nr:hypothetical protein S101446_00459 [Komagataeibacter europaeus]
MRLSAIVDRDDTGGGSHAPTRFLYGQCRADGLRRVW